MGLKKLVFDFCVNRLRVWFSFVVLTPVVTSGWNWLTKSMVGWQSRWQFMKNSYPLDCRVDPVEDNFRLEPSSKKNRAKGKQPVQLFWRFSSGGYVRPLEKSRVLERFQSLSVGTAMQLVFTMFHQMFIPKHCLASVNSMFALANGW